MKEDRTISDNQLRKAFKEFPLENLSPGFMEDLMSKIEKETVSQRRTKKLIAFLQIIAGIASIILLPVLAVYLCNRFIPGFSFSFSNLKINFDINSVLIGLAILLLLIIDSLHKRHEYKRQFKNE
jgi:flagellar biosynthesis protein FlhB